MASQAPTARVPQAESSSRLSERQFRSNIAGIARQFSRMRKMDRLKDPVALDNEIGSSGEEMDADWRRSIVFWLERFTTRELAFGDLEQGCYVHFEGIWLDDIKHYKAYFQWVDNRDDATYWTSFPGRDDHYFRACAAIREALLKRPAKEKPQSFQNAIRYITENYEPGTRQGTREQLIQRKTEKIPQLRERARGYAEKFVKDFYSNIVPAVEERRRDAIKAVLDALRHGGSERGVPDIVNGFETLLVLLLLDRDTVASLWSTGEVDKDSTL